MSVSILKNNGFANRYRILSQFIVFLLILSSFCIVNFSILPKAIASRATDSEPNDIFENATLLMDDSVSGGEVTDQDPVDYYKVNLDIGQTVAIELSAEYSGTDNITLKFFDKDNNELYNSGLVLPNMKIFYNYTVNQTPNGPYYIGVFAEGYGNLYDLKTTINSQNDAGTNTDAPDNIKSALEVSSDTYNGFLAVMDVNDYYFFKINPGRIINFNFTVKTGSDPVNFNIYNNTQSNTIKAYTDVAAGTVKNFRYTTDSNGSRTFYIGVNIDYNHRSRYSINLDILPQEDGHGYVDAADNFTSPSPLTVEGNYSGWLGAGNFGLDYIDIYNITVPAGNNTFFVNITPEATLDFVIYILNDKLIQIKSINPKVGEQVRSTYIFNTSKRSIIFIKLEIPMGQSSQGGYFIEFDFVTNKPPTGDTDSDNIPDIWEIKYGLDPEDESDAEGDKDNDTFTNLQEFKSKTDPTDPKNHPTTADDYSHLTSAACLRSYVDPANDVFHWYGTYDDSSEFVNIDLSELVSKDSYDIISLDSARVDKTLEVKLKLGSKVENLGSIEELDEEMTLSSATFYQVVFVNKSFTELAITGNELPEFLEASQLLIEIPLTYINKSFLGPIGTDGELLDNDKTIFWKVPLKELTELPADFGIYAFVYNFEVSAQKSSRSRAKHYFHSYADSTGVGSKIHEKMNKIEKNIGIGGRAISVTITTEDSGGFLLVTELDEPPEILVPTDISSLGIYFDVSLIGVNETNEIMITTEYKDEDIPKGYDEKNIKFYYLDLESGKWIKVKNSGVWKDNNTAWAKPDHLTIFALMTEGASDDSDNIMGLDANLFYLLLIILIIVIVIIIVLVFFILRSKRRLPDPEREPPQTRTRALKPEFFECPRCGEDIEIPYSDNDKVLLQCPNCQAKGKVDNPYLGEDEDYHQQDYDYDDSQDHYRRYDRGERRRDYHRDHEREYDEEYERDYEQDRERDYGEEYEKDYDSDYYSDDDEFEDYDEIEYTPPKHKKKHTHTREISRDRKKVRIGEPETKSKPATYYEDDDDYEYKDCPKCGESIPVPYDEADKVLLECPSCGARGRVKNPYLQ